jgi:hypothetical protein
LSQSYDTVTLQKKWKYFISQKIFWIQTSKS